MVLVPAVAVGAAGTPVKVGLATGALVLSVPCTWSSRANLVATPTAAVPFTAGVAEPA